MSQELKSISQDARMGLWVKSTPTAPQMVHSKPATNKGPKAVIIAASTPHTALMICTF